MTPSSTYVIGKHIPSLAQKARKAMPNTMVSNARLHRSNDKCLGLLIRHVLYLSLFSETWKGQSQKSMVSPAYNGLSEVLHSATQVGLDFYTALADLEGSVGAASIFSRPPTASTHSINQNGFI